MFHALFLAAVSLLFVGDEDLLLRPGQRVSATDVVRLAIDTEGSYTVVSDGGTLQLGEQRSADGWLSIELSPGEHRVELPDGPGTLTLLRGEVEARSVEEFINEGINALNRVELRTAETLLSAARARADGTPYADLARLFLGLTLHRLGGRDSSARELLSGWRAAARPFGPSVELPIALAAGQLHVDLHEWAEAAAAFEHVRTLDQGGSAEALALSGLAQVAAGLGAPDRAAEIHAQALAALSEGVDADRVAMTLVRYRAALFAEQRADFVGAESLLLQAIDAAPSWSHRVRSLGSLASVELVLGKYSDAFATIERAQALAAPHSPSRFDAPLLQNRAAVAFALGEIGLARRALLDLLPLQTHAGSRAETHANLSALALSDDDLESAAALAAQALSLAPDATRDRWLALNTSAAVLIKSDRRAQAAERSFEALRLAIELDDPYLHAVSLLGAAEGHRHLGEADKSLELAEAALASLDQAGALDLRLSALHAVARAALDSGDEQRVASLLDEAWAEFGREAVTSLPTLQAAQLRSRLLEISDWGEIATDLARRRLTRAPDTAGAELFGVARWKSRTQGEAASARRELKPAEFETLSATLGDKVFVEFVVGEDLLCAFVIDGAAARFVELGALRPVERLIADYLEGLVDEQSLADAPTVQRLGGELHARLLAPLDLPSGTLVIAPIGELARLPFEALVSGAAPGPIRFDSLRFVIDERDVAYVPSALALRTSRRITPSNSSGRTLLIGDPSYASEQSSQRLAARGANAADWPRLPRSRDELLRQARILLTRSDDAAARDALFELTRREDERHVALDTEPFLLRLGENASARALRELAPTASRIHVAAHAHVDRRDSRRSGLVLAAVEDDTNLFSLEDIVALELDAELVVLSACSTADGRLLNGEGVHSLASAFHTAGAQGVIATLWPVVDTQARDLMEAFTEASLGEGRSPVEALGIAKRALRTGSQARGKSLTGRQASVRRGHPHDWAAFLYSGSFDP